jgi:hypothetical protein
MSARWPASEAVDIHGNLGVMRGATRCSLDRRQRFAIVEITDR